MRHWKAILGALIIILMAIFMLFGKIGPDDPKNIVDFWCSFDFTVQDILVIFLATGWAWERHKRYRDKIFPFILKLIAGIYLFRLILDIYSFFNPEMWEAINTSYEIGGIFVTCIIIIIIYNSYNK